MRQNLRKKQNFARHQSEEIAASIKKKKVIKGTFQVERLEKKCNIFIGKKKIEKDPEV